MCECEDVVSVGFINYIVGVIWIFFEFLLFFESLIFMMLELSWGVGVGFVMGGCYFIVYFFVIYIVWYVGVVSFMVVGVFFILLLILCGVWIWNECFSVF